MRWDLDAMGMDEGSRKGEEAKMSETDAGASATIKSCNHEYKPLSHSMMVFKMFHFLPSLYHSLIFSTSTYPAAFFRMYSSFHLKIFHESTLSRLQSMPWRILP